MQLDISKTRIDQDELGRTKFAKDLAKSLVQSRDNGDDSFVVGITGKWGSGKTTVLNFIIEELEEQLSKVDQNYKIVKFNPWMFSNQEKLQEAFLRQLQTEIGGRKEQKRKTLRFIKSVSKQAKTLKYLHSGAGEIANAISEFLDGIGQEKTIYQLKATVDKILQDNSFKLFIVIDDVDRLTPREILDIFQLVKLNASFVNTIFLVAFDKEVVVEALNNEYKTSGERYLEKIIQVDYSLPELSGQRLKDYFSNGLKSLFKEIEVEFDVDIFLSAHWHNELSKFISTTRDAIRLFNSIELRIISIHKEINIDDFILIETLRLFDNKAYRFVFENHDSFLESIKSSPFNQSNDRASFKDEIRKLSPGSSNILLKMFFNKEQPIVSNNLEELLRKRNISHPYFFHKYFILELRQKEPSTRLIKIFLEGNREEKSEVLRSVREDEYDIVEFLNHVEAHFSSINAVHQELCIVVMIQSLKDIEYVREIFTPPTYQSFVRFTLFKLLNDNFYGDKAPVILNKISHIVSQDLNLHLKVFWDEIIRSIENLKNGKEDLTRGWMASTDHNSVLEVLQPYQSAYLCLIGQKVVSSLSEYGFDEIKLVMYDYHQQCEKEYLKGISTVLKSVKCTLLLIRVCISRAWQRGSRVGFALAEHQFYPGFDKSQIDKTLSGIEESDLNQEELKTLRFYQKAKTDGFIDKKYYDFDTLEELNFHL